MLKAHARGHGLVRGLHRRGARACAERGAAASPGRVRLSDICADGSEGAHVPDGHHARGRGRAQGRKVEGPQGPANLQPERGRGLALHGGRARV